MRGAAAVFALVTAVLLLGEMAWELVHGRLLVIEADRIGWGTAALVAAWLVAVVFTAWLMLDDERRERR